MIFMYTENTPNSINALQIRIYNTKHTHKYTNIYPTNPFFEHVKNPYFSKRKSNISAFYGDLYSIIYTLYILCTVYFRHFHKISQTSAAL